MEYVTGQGIDWTITEVITLNVLFIRELYTLVNKMANVLKSHGVERGDRVAIYMPSCPMAVAAMLASSRIGAVHSVIFAGFSAESLASRIDDAQAKVIMTCDQGVRGGAEAG